MTSSAVIEPVAPDERVQLLDVLRGFAILGMWTVNMTLDIWWGHQYREAPLATADFASVVLVDLFANGKFITIFSVLFGIGFFIQMERARTRQVSAAAFYVRRSLGLLLIAVLAMACTIPAWILIDYALYGLALTLLYQRSPKTILTAALGCVFLAGVLAPVAHDYRQSTELTMLAEEQGVPVSDVWRTPDSEREAYNTTLREGGFLEVSAVMLDEVWTSFSEASYYLNNLDLLGLLLIGVYIARRGAVRDTALRCRMARRVLPWALGIGFVSCLVWVAMEDFGVGDETSLAHTIIHRLAGWPIGMPLLGLGYAAGIALLIERESWRRRLAPFAAVGRMALTNYLFTGFVAAFVSFRWGLGLYGAVTPLAGLAIVFTVYPLQLLASRWWLRRFNHGPIEWLWRYMTYGRLSTARPRPAGI